MKTSLKKIGETVSEKISQATGLTQASVTHSDVFTTYSGCPFADIKNSMTAGPMGPVVASDTQLFEKIQRFTREKIPARNVHALGTGAWGLFTVTNDITKYTKADLFSSVGKTTKLISRFSGVFTEQGDADLMRDPRGFALKFYSNEGNWDLLTINTPVFAVRDAKPGPDLIHAFKRDPRNGMWNPTQTWDFVATHPEGLHQMVMIYTDTIGTPRSYRYMDCFGCNTYSLINANNERFWVKFHLRNMQGDVQGFTYREAAIVRGVDPNFLARDLHTSIENGQYPRWKLYIQVMTEEEGYKNSFTFDCTKVWRHADYPLIEVGEIEINKNPVNYHAEVEQVAFSPANLVPGIGSSPDKLLQGRLLIYDDTQNHRIGSNFKQLYINRPHNVEPQNNYYGGPMNMELKDKFPHYSPSVFGTLKSEPRSREPPLRVTGPIDYYDYPGEGSDEDYYGQVRLWWDTLSDQQRNNMCDNIAFSLGKVTEQKIVDMMLQHFEKVTPAWKDIVKSKYSNQKKIEEEMLVDMWFRELQPSQEPNNSSRI